MERYRIRKWIKTKDCFVKTISMSKWGSKEFLKETYPSMFEKAKGDDKFYFFQKMNKTYSSIKKKVMKIPIGYFTEDKDSIYVDGLGHVEYWKGQAKLHKNSDIMVKNQFFLRVDIEGKVIETNWGSNKEINRWPHLIFLDKVAEHFGCLSGGIGV